jgi:hypothetical protein
MIYKLLAASVLLTITSALPVVGINSTPSFLFSRQAGASAVTQLESIAPASTTCDGAPFPSECATASQAAPFLINALSTYSIYSPPEITALLSLIAFETGDFKYAINHFPGRAGQGTRNMQMANFNLEFALSIPELKDAATAIAPAGTTTGLSDAQLNSIRALVLPDEYAWASAAWFLTTKCASIRSQLQAGGIAGWTAYLGCVGTTATADRTAYWTRANAAFGLS